MAGRCAAVMVAGLAALVAQPRPAWAATAGGRACVEGLCQESGGGPRDQSLLQLQHRSGRTLASARQEEECHSLLEGEECYDRVQWAMTHGIFDYPEWYPAPLSPASSWEDFQAHLHELHPESCPRPCPRAPLPSEGERCVSRAVHLDFFHSAVTHRNLGGLGPDSGPENMRYSKVGNRTVGSKVSPFDLVVTASKGYKQQNSKHTGLSGSYGIVNLKSPSAVDLTFSFEDSATGEPVVLEAFHFSFFDIDQSQNAGERMLVGGFESYTVDPETEVKIWKAKDGRTRFQSTRIGKLCDNPRDPLKLGVVKCGGQTVDQKKRAVTFLFSNRSSFEVTLRTSCSSKARGRCFGRNFLFSGSSSLSHTCEEAVQPGLCAAFGDPHFVTFDGAHTVLLRHQAFWLVRSRDVWMQALSKDGDGKLAGIAVGGPFLDGHTLVVRKTSPFDLEAAFDGEAILNQAADEFRVPGIIEGHRSQKWNATLHSNDILAVRTQIRFSVGPWPERFFDPVGGLFLFKLPGEVELTVTGSDVMSLVITMPPQAGGQAGYCGNFDGNAADDFEPVGPSFHRPIGDSLGPVDPSEALFDPSSWGSANGAAPAEIDPEAVLRDCHKELLEMAQQRCRVVTDVRMQEDCVFDVCATGLIVAADGVLAAEILEEKVNARGIPLLMGQGQCLDSIGQNYVAFDTNLGTPADCTDVLRSLALNGGVRGAQLHDAGTCQILVDNEADPTAVQIRGGWGAKVGGSAQGHGIISNMTGAEGWSCWQVV